MVKIIYDSGRKPDKQVFFFCGIKCFWWVASFSGEQKSSIYMFGWVWFG